MPTRPKSHRQLIRAAVLLAGLGWFALLPLRDVLRFPDRVSVLGNLQTDAAAYDAIARDLAASWRSDVLPPKHPPGWITILAAIYAIAGPSYVAGKLVSWIAYLIAIGLCAWLARRVYGVPAAWAAALVCASSPAFRGYIGTLQYEVVTATLLLAVLALADRAAPTPRPPAISIPPSDLPPRRRWRFLEGTAVGLAAAMLVLTRETFVAAVPLLALWMFLRSRRQAALAAAVMLGVAAAPAIAWSAIQSQRAGKLITISEKGAMVIELGHNPLANGTYNAPLVGVAQPTGAAFALAYPGREIALSIRKVLYFWGVLRDGWNVPHPAAVWAWRATAGVVPLQAIETVVRGGWLLALFAAALWVYGRERWRDWWILPAIIGVVMAIHVATLASYRFAVPTLPLVYVVVSGPIARGAQAAARVVSAPAVAAACLLLGTVLVAMQFQEWPLRLTYDAVDLDGVDAANARDEVAGTLARIADARRGVRPIALLPDEYLPKGTVALTVRARRLGGTPSPAPAARLAMIQLDGRPACSMDVAASELPAAAFRDLTTRCTLEHDGAATVLVYSLGVVDLAVETVRLTWMR